MTTIVRYDVHAPCVAEQDSVPDIIESDAHVAGAVKVEASGMGRCTVARLLMTVCGVPGDTLLALTIVSMVL